MVSLDHEAEMALYRQLAGLRRERIASGEIARRMPSLKSLVQEFGSRRAERALTLLRDEGLIRSVMGRGHFVVPPGERPDAR